LYPPTILKDITTIFLVSEICTHFKEVPVVDSVVDTKGEAAVKQVMKCANGGRGRLQKSHDAGRIRSVQKNDGHEERDGHYSAGYSLGFHCYAYR
jgi:hypothetical protein